MAHSGRMSGAQLLSLCLISRLSLFKLIPGGVSPRPSVWDALSYLLIYLISGNGDDDDSSDNDKNHDYDDYNYHNYNIDSEMVI